MILGIGSDIIEIARIKKNIECYRGRFLNRIFTVAEQNYCLNRKEPSVHFAGRFAAKEAIVKALGTGFIRGISWQDIEILPDEKGKPVVKLSPPCEELFNFPNLLVTISHCRSYATAFAVWTSK